MKLENVMKAMELIRTGAFTHFEYISELPVKAEFKKQGIKVYKYTSMVARFRVNYSNIKTVIERRNNSFQSSKPINSNFKWIMKHAVSYNSNTGNTSLHIYTGANTRSKNEYLVVSPKGTTYFKDEETFNASCQNLIIPSYFNKTTKSEVFQVNIKNVINIGGRC